MREHLLQQFRPRENRKKSIDRSHQDNGNVLVVHELSSGRTKPRHLVRGSHSIVGEKSSGGTQDASAALGMRVLFPWGLILPVVIRLLAQGGQPHGFGRAAGAAGTASGLGQRLIVCDSE